ncbi:DUF4247 domain-containing protein [Sediminibacillus dalangtanensis]|uniref:DUF4247 domain-containing protein n=1 Tax=Sediminibacillus dalangtanensis TaxID=2729421 RepID=A0ABX7VU70_9BACI|nr:DUF4247 domain-containing protein [Sediminibacillus dalangtanensis]QTN00074.1 DUF4247 domain-containing protein [Sediminibacillus dalangtanensis]
MHKILGVCLLSLVLLLTACGSGLSQLQGTEEEPSVSVEEIPDEPDRQEIEEQLKASSNQDIEAIFANNFYLLDVVTGDDAQANVYATRQFKREQLISLVSSIKKPDEKSEVKDGEQILIYPDYFVTFKPSEEDQDVLLIEVASDQFVRSNYSPNHLNGFFTFLLLNRMLGTSNWEKSRMDQCRSGGCYGGYTTGDRGGLNTKRGMSSYRGGGASAGK